MAGVLRDPRLYQNTRNNLNQALGQILVMYKKQYKIKVSKNASENLLKKKKKNLFRGKKAKAFESCSQ